MELEACEIPPAYWEVYKVVSKALGRSVAACLPLNSLQSTEQIAVKVRVQREPHLQTNVAGQRVLLACFNVQACVFNVILAAFSHLSPYACTVQDTGRPITDSAEARQFALCLLCKSAGMQPS